MLLNIVQCTNHRILHFSKDGAESCKQLTIKLLLCKTKTMNVNIHKILLIENF